jgi:hypothetical protein
VRTEDVAKKAILAANGGCGTGSMAAQLLEAERCADALASQKAALQRRLKACAITDIIL